MEKKFVDKARIELREDELRKNQSLAIFRDWLSKHPFLSGVRQGEATLVQTFLKNFEMTRQPFICSIISSFR
jgi:hypothetical protein